MIQRNLVLTALATLAIAACQQHRDDSNIAIDDGLNAAEAVNATVETVPPSESSVAAPAPAPAAPVAAAIPAAFRGRWGLGAADCDPARADAKGLLTIGDRTLTFYESKGTLAAVLSSSANAFDGRYAFAGEGQTWRRTERLALAGDRLQRRTDREPGQEPPVDLTYTRCRG